MIQQLSREFLGNKYGKRRLKKTTEVDLTSCGINKIKPNAFKIKRNILDFKGLNVKVDTLNLDSNEISEIESKTFHYLPNLKHLYLSNNKLKNFDSSIFKEYLVNLETLHLNNNELEKISFKNLSNLKELYLNGNKLVSIYSSTFSGLENLIILDLENNKIERIDKFSFESLSKLKVLKLNNNKLKRIDMKCFEGLKSIEVIQLYENELNVRSFFNKSTNLPSICYEIDRLNQHGFLTGLKDFLDQFILHKSKESIEEFLPSLVRFEFLSYDHIIEPKKEDLLLKANIEHYYREREIIEIERREREERERERREREIHEEQSRNIEERPRF